MIPERALGKRNLNPHEKIIIASTEAIFWSITGLLYPPLFLGIISNACVIVHNSIKLGMESNKVHPLKVARIP